MEDMDIKIKESGLRKGNAKLSKCCSGLLMVVNKLNRAKIEGQLDTLAKALKARSFVPSHCPHLKVNGHQQVLYITVLCYIHREDSTFGVYYQLLVEHRLQKGSALMVVMPAMLVVSITTDLARIRLRNTSGRCSKV